MQPELHHCPGFPTLDTIEAGLIAVIWSSLVITACHSTVGLRGSMTKNLKTCGKQSFNNNQQKNCGKTVLSPSNWLLFTRFPPAPQSGRWCCLSASAPPSRFPQVLDSIAYICHQHLGHQETDCESRRVAWNPKQKFLGNKGPNHHTIKHQMLAPSSALLTVKRPLLLRSRETLGTASLHSSFTGMKMASHTGIIRTSEKVLTKLEPQQQQK